MTQKTKEKLQYHIISRATLSDGWEAKVATWMEGSSFDCWHLVVYPVFHYTTTPFCRSEISCVRLIHQKKEHLFTYRNQCSFSLWTHFQSIYLHNQDRCWLVPLFFPRLHYTKGNPPASGRRIFDSWKHFGQMRTRSIKRFKPLCKNKGVLLFWCLI